MKDSSYLKSLFIDGFHTYFMMLMPLKANEVIYYQEILRLLTKRKLKHCKIVIIQIKHHDSSHLL